MKEQTGIMSHENTLRSRLKELGYAYLRPKHDLSALQDKEAKERAVDTLDMLKKSRSWRNRPILYGRNHNRFVIPHHSMLDETWAAKTVSNTRYTKVVSSVWCLQLAN